MIDDIINNTYGHSFQPIEKPLFYVSDWHEINSWYLCKICHLIIGNSNNDYLFFLYHKKEIYNEYITLDEVNLTCNEFIIKYIIE